MSFDFTFVRLFGVILLLPLFKVNYALQNMFVRWGRILGIMWGSCMFYYLLVWYLKLYIGVLRVVAFRNTQLDQSIVPYHKGLGKHVRSWCFLLPLYITIVAENDKWYIITNHKKAVILIVDVSVMSE
jgi:hypothetical protein